MSRSVLLFALVALVCASVVSAQTCSGAGYTLDALAGTTYSYSTNPSSGGTNYTFLLSPCGVVSNSNCSNAAFCQIGTDSGSYYPLQFYNASATVQWVAVPGGVQQIVQDGAWCAAINAFRETTIFFQCNASATTPFFTGVQEFETCHYMATLQTSSACTATSTTGSNGVGSSFISSVCGGGVYDLSSLNTDLYYNSNASSTTSGFNYWLHLCGAVSNSSCNQVSNSMACQTDKNSPPDQNSLAVLNASVPTIYTINTNGLTMQIQDGTLCGGDGPRELTVNLICSAAATTPILSSVSESEVCHYTATVMTAAVCGGATVGSSSGGVPVASSSAAAVSSSTGVPASSTGVVPASSTGTNTPVASSSSVIVIVTNVSSSTGAAPSQPASAAVPVSSASFSVLLICILSIIAVVAL